MDRFSTSIVLAGQVVSTSKNLRGMKDYAKTSPVHRVYAYRDKKLSCCGVLEVEYENGATCRAEFASYCVLLEWLYKRRSWRAAPFWTVEDPNTPEDYRITYAFDSLKAKGLV